MPTNSFYDRKCLITGAASGIGKATAFAAAREGAILILTDINGSALQRVAEDIGRIGGKVAIAQALNITDFESVRRFADDIHAKCGSLDVLMNIAGISVWGAVENLHHQHWRDVIEVNLMGPIHIMECFLPAMIDAGRGGHLVNVSSAAGLFGLPWHAAYSASKFGLRGVSEVLRFDLARHDIGVSLVCPGGVDTGLVNTVQIVGVGENSPALDKMRKRFRKHAVSPEKAAKAIIDGVNHSRFLIFTSLDIRVGYWFQRKFAWPYEMCMRLLNNQLHAATAKSGIPRGTEH